MKTGSCFYFISEEQFKKDGVDRLCNYEDLNKLPKRATKGSAGYDFYSICDFDLKPGERIKLPTGVSVCLPSDCFLLCAPRSSLGFKYRLQMDNTIGIIDSDYSESDNEGHIWVSFTNCGDKEVHIKKGEAIFQGIILPFGITTDDDAVGVRNGGFGSTNNYT